MIGIAADLLHPAFHVRIEPLGVRHRLEPAAKTTSAVSAASWRPASEAPAWTMTGQPCTGRAILSGPRTEKIFPLVVEHMHLVGIEIDAAVDVAHEGVVGKAVP